VERLTASFADCNIWESDSEHLYGLIRFLITENYMRHTGICETDVPREEIADVYLEELQYVPFSRIFAARDTENRIIGTVRVMRWDGRIELPMQKIFGKPVSDEALALAGNETVWHIGRFAVARTVTRLSLSKQLLVCALAPVFAASGGIMLAECDTKLFRALSAAGLRINPLGEPVHCLGSETIPVYATRQGVEDFYNREFALLQQKSSCDVRDALFRARKLSKEVIV
jgi:hypothetical protein